MMMKPSISKKQVINFVHQEKVIGKWNKNTYIIDRLLGYGATGNVYLARSKEGMVALKIASSTNTMSISSEVNILRQFAMGNKVQGPHLGPYFYEADDYICKFGVFPFYVMEYIDGDPFLSFIKKRGTEWLGIFLLQLLNDLHQIHQLGYVFGDLKPENLLIDKKKRQLRWFDPGGMTRHGRSIKEYTEFFDRGYWGMGTRRAEPSYDLFSVSMLLLNVGYPSRFEKNNLGKGNGLLKKFREKGQLLAYEKVFIKGIEGKYNSALEMREDVLDVVRNVSFSVGNKKEIRKQPHVRKKQRKNRSKRWIGIVESLLVASFLLILYILYLFGQAF